MLRATTAIEGSDLVALALFAVATVVSIALWRGGHIRAAWWVWAMAVAGATVPFFDLHDHTHWVNVSWVPFEPVESKVSDVAANLLIYLPLGLLTPRGPRSRRPMPDAVLRALVLSVLAESAQLFSHSRIPSTTDVICNTLGAAAGVWLSATLTTRTRSL
jgi:hypothetical protein